MVQKTIKEWVQDGAMIVDVRTPSEFSEGSIENAVNIPLNEIENRISEFDNKPAVIVFCRSGSRSAMARTILAKYQIPNLYNGINEEFMRMQFKDFGKKERFHGNFGGIFRFDAIQSRRKSVVFATNCVHGNFKLKN